METRRTSTRKRRESIKVEEAKAEAAKEEAAAKPPPPKKQKVESPLRKKVHKIHARKSDAKAQPEAQSPKGASPSSNRTKGTPLPTSDVTLDTEETPMSELQSIAESGILAASLQKSRTRWLTECFFEKYWTKPSKKKDHPQISNNPAKESMSKLGPCKIVIEPHTFDATLFTLRQWPPVAPQPKSQPRPIIQYGVPPPPNAGPAPSAYSTPNTRPGSSSSTPGPSSGSIPNQIPTKSPIVKVEPQNTSQTGPSSTTKPNSTPQSWNNQPPRTTTPNQPNPPAPAPAPAAPKPSQDPVIQMLAQRASTSPELKILMKIVASGNASPAQLKVFQSHIDDLTGIIQRQNKANAATTTTTTTNNPSNPNPSAHPQNQPTPYTNPPQTTHPPTQTPYHHPPPSPIYFQPPPPKSKPYTHHHTKFETIGTAFEFASGSGDRFHFPRYSVLEYSIGSRVLKASFFVVRKGAASDAADYSPDTEYFQPVTMAVHAENPHMLETIARNVASLDEVKRHMADVMKSATRAHDRDLTLQLPKKHSSTSADAGTPLPDAKRTYGASPAPRGGKHKHNDDLSNRCRYCYATVPHATPRDTDGACVCEDCARLVSRADGVARTARTPFALRGKTASGPLALTLPVGVF